MGSNAATALRFLSNLYQPAFAWASPRPLHFLRGGDERLDVDLYAPRGAPLGAILMVHGMNIRAHRDPRLVSACQSMAASGFLAIAPRFPQIGHAVIATESIGRIADAIAFSARLNGGPVGVFAPSFSAGMSLIASTHEAANGCVSGVLSMGGYCDPRRVVRYVLEDGTAHFYSLLIILKNFLRRSLGPVPAIEAVLEQAVVDEGLRREPRFAELLEQLGGDERALLHGLLYDAKLRRAHAEPILVRDDDQLLERLSVASIVERLRVPVTLFHGCDDSVIPAGESVELARLMRGRGLEVHLNVSPLISHGDRQSLWQQPKGVIDAVQMFSHFFGNVIRPISPSELKIEPLAQ